MTTALVPPWGRGWLVTRATGCNRYCVTRMKYTQVSTRNTMCTLPQLSTWGHSYVDWRKKRERKTFKRISFLLHAIEKGSMPYTMQTSYTDKNFKNDPHSLYLGLSCAACRFQFPDQGPNLCPLQWKHRALNAARKPLLLALAQLLPPLRRA